MPPISALQIPTWLDVQRKLRDCDQNHHLPNLNLIGEVEEGVELLLAAGETEIDPTSEGFLWYLCSKCKRKYLDEGETDDDKMEEYKDELEMQQEEENLPYEEEI